MTVTIVDRCVSCAETDLDFVSILSHCLQMIMNSNPLVPSRLVLSPLLLVKAWAAFQLPGRGYKRVFDQLSCTTSLILEKWLEVK